jgi:predicted RecB family nuclease
MQIIDGRTIYAASDLNDFLECAHLSELSRLVARHELEKPARDESLALIGRKGDEHEVAYLVALRETHGDDLIEFAERPENTHAGLLAAEAAAVAAMASGARIIYQATFFDGTFLGRADFLRRVDTPSARWPWSYEVIDTKLALSTKPYFLLQLCNYSEHLRRIQGSAPLRASIVLGSGIEQSFPLIEYAAYYRHVKATFLERAPALGRSYPVECPHCSICIWAERCEAQRERDDYLGLVANMRRSQIDRFVESGIGTLSQLAAARDEQKPLRMSEETFVNLRTQAQLQLRQRLALAAGKGLASYAYQFRERDPSSGFSNLPKPAAGDVFFDIEGDPLYRPGRGLEYLFGLYLPDEDRYIAFWAKSFDEERAAFEQLVDFIVDRRRRFPDAHVYHYAPYEMTALKRLMGIYGSREDAVDDFLRSEAFVDLYPVARQAMWISQPSYSLKKFEIFYGLVRLTATKRGDDSIVMFESWLASRDPAILQDIQNYNEDDCRSTYQLREWLLARRQDLENETGPIPWYAPENKVPKEDDEDATERERLLLANRPEPESLEALRGWSEGARGHWLLGNLLRYYRREAKPDWWKYFERAKNVEQLKDLDRKALGGLVHDDAVEPRKLGPRDRLFVHWYTFPPQEFDIKRKDSHCPDSKSTAGDVVEIDEVGGRIAIKVAGNIDPLKLRALIPRHPIYDGQKRDAIAAIADAYLADTISNGNPATLDLLLARSPRLSDRPRGAVIQPQAVSRESVSAVVASLDRSYLFVQGPPGSGKSTVGAATIVDLLQAGKRIGLAANTHKALHNLLGKIEETAAIRGFRFRGVHKHSNDNEGSAYESQPDCLMVESSADGAAFDGPDCQLASGTAFAWSGKSQRKFDYIFIDEAGQVSLPDALVISMRAENVVLLGDPLQLPNVTQGSHPIGVKLSILEHVLGDAVTVPETRGVFLDNTYRMHPDIARFVSDTIYEGRLESAPGTEVNHVASPGLSGSGLRYLPIDHSGNDQRSAEEADCILAEVRSLLQGEVEVRGEPRRQVRQRDIMIVTPYNAQRIFLDGRLKSAGLDGVRVGTVDKFQGQEAPVVFYSMATSSDEDMPRDKDFLFDKNRFNVAISRAQALSIVVCSPKLLDTRCTTTLQMSLVNLLCAFVEYAAPRSGAASNVAESLR